jgi:hypothetical protein
MTRRRLRRDEEVSNHVKLTTEGIRPSAALLGARRVVGGGETGSPMRGNRRQRKKELRAARARVREMGR